MMNIIAILMACKIRVIKNPYLLTETQRFEKALLEMDNSRQNYIDFIRENAWNLYSHLICVVVLENYFPEMVQYWRGEIHKCCVPIITKLDNKNINRGECIEKYMMDEYMGIHFEDYSVDEFEVVLKNESKKAEKEIEKLSKTNDTASRNKIILFKKEVNVIRTKVMPIIGEFVFPNKNRLMYFYDGFKLAADERDVDMFEEVLDEFLSDTPIFDED